MTGKKKKKPGNSPGDDMGGYGGDWPKPGTKPKPEDVPPSIPGFLVMKRRGKSKFINDPTTGPNA